MYWLDRATFPFAPRWTNKRIAARFRADLMARAYEAASSGRRTQGWRRTSGDPNSEVRSGGAITREHARDLVRNNPYAESALSTVVDHTVGWGIVPKPAKGTPKATGNRLMDKWRQWAETTACDADGRLDFAGLEKLVMRTAVEAGEVLVRRRWRRPTDGLPIPMQLQVIEPDYLDTSKDGVSTPNGGQIVQGIEYDAIGRRTAYWLFREHPGSTSVGFANSGASQSSPVPASEILHVFKAGRPGQSRGVTWFAPVILRLKDFDEYEDAALMKQKIAACLAVLTTDPDGTTSPIGEPNTEQPTWDGLQPGLIANLPPGKTITVVNPPRVDEHASYSETVLRAVASGFGVTYEDLTGSYSNMPFSAARMSRIRHWARVEDWRWRMLIPQFCDPVWQWVQEAILVGTDILDKPISAEWTAPPPAMIDPEAEGRAYMMRLRIGATTWPEMIRELGYDPDAQLTEAAEWKQKLAAAGLIFDGDPSVTTQQGGPRESAAAQTNPAID